MPGVTSDKHFRATWVADASSQRADRQGTGQGAGRLVSFAGARMIVP